MSGMSNFSSPFMNSLELLRNGGCGRSFDRVLGCTNPDYSWVSQLFFSCWDLVSNYIEVTSTCNVLCSFRDLQYLYFISIEDSPDFFILLAWKVFFESFFQAIDLIRELVAPNVTVIMIMMALSRFVIVDCLR
jgi:hypothetical protein